MKTLYRAPLWAMLAGSLTLAGCVSLPGEHERSDPAAMQADLVSGWESLPAMSYRPLRTGLHLVTPHRLPVETAATPIRVQLARPISIAAFAALLDQAGVTVVVSDPQLLERTIYLPRYNGTLGALLETITEATDLAYSWRGNALVLDVMTPYMVRIPQNKDLAETLSKAIEQMGGDGIQVQHEAGVVLYRASNRAQASIQAYLERLAANTVLINLQIAVITVSLDDQHRRGFDWSNFNLEIGDLAPQELLSNALNPGVPGLPGQGGAEALEAVRFASGTLSGAGFTAGARRGNLDLSATLRMLSRFGQSETTQNATLATLSGLPVMIRSGDTIPYVEDIGVSNLSTQSQFGYGNALSSVNISEVQTGFHIEATPYYDADEQVITVDLTLELKTLLGFRELQAGVAGEVTRPEISEQAFTSIVKMGAGETVLTGGLIYTSVSDNYATLAGLERRRAGSQNRTETRSALFILMRPTVTVYGAPAEVRP